MFFIDGIYFVILLITLFMILLITLFMILLMILFIIPASYFIILLNIDALYLLLKSIGFG